MQIFIHDGEGCKEVFYSKTWKVALLHHSQNTATLCSFERHLETDEVFVLLRGDATLYTKDEKEKITATKLQPNCVYVVKKAEWHHTVMETNAEILLVENENTSQENTEIRYL